MGLNIPAGPSFQAKDFFGLVQCFGSNEQKQYVKEIQDGIATYEALRAEVRAEDSRLKGLAADIETGKAELERKQAALDKATDAHLAAAAKDVATNKQTADDLAAERARLTTLAGTLGNQETALKDAKEALARDRADHERKVADDNTALDARAQAVADAEASLNERKAKFLAAKEALGE